MKDLRPYFSRIEFLQETARQIIKDFQLSGIEIRLGEKPENAYQELFDKILPEIEKLQNENFQNFYNLLYRIDLSEARIKKEMAQTTDKTFAELITDLIIKRELVKVIIRKGYASGEEL